MLALGVLSYSLWLCTQPNFISDIFWQIRLGDEIRFRHSIPKLDEFSWSCPGRPIVLHEWGTCVAFAEFYHHFGGWTGIFILEMIIAVTLLMSVHYLISRRIPKNPFIAFFLTLAAGRLCGQFITPRPHLFTFLGLVFSIGILFYCRKLRKIPMGALLGLIAVEVVWANMHAGGPIFIAICLAYAIGDGLQSLLIARADPDRASYMMNQAGMALACGVVTILAMSINPSGFAIYKIVTDTVGDKTMPSKVTEWLPVDFHIEYGTVVELFLFVIGVSLAAARRDLRYGDLMVLSFLSLSALYAIRNVPILGMAGSIIVAPYTVGAWNLLIRRYTFTDALNRYILSRKSMYAPTAAVCLGATISLGLVSSIRTNLAKCAPVTAAGFISHTYQLELVPEDACRFIEQERIPPTFRLYNEYNTGGYLISRLPEYPVFVSTETFVYFGKVFDTYIGLEDLPFDWRSQLAPYHPDFVLMGTDDRQAHLFLNAPEWALVFAGGRITNDPLRPVNLVFIKRTQANEALIARCRKDCQGILAVREEGYPSAR